MIYIDLLHYLNLDKAEQGEKINQLVKEIYEKEEASKTLDAQIANSECWLYRLLCKPENLHFKDYESAMYYFEELVEDIMSDWNSETKVKEVLTDCYIGGILYSPKFDGDKWTLGEDFIEM
jgi:hypothetical protein